MGGAERRLRRHRQNEVPWSGRHAAAKDCTEVRRWSRALPTEPSSPGGDDAESLEERVVERGQGRDDGRRIGGAQRFVALVGRWRAREDDPSRAILLRHLQPDPGRRERLPFESPQGIPAGEIVTHKVARVAQAGLERIDPLAQLMAVQRHAGLQPQGIARAETGGDDSARLALFENCLPNLPRNAGRQRSIRNRPRRYSRCG